jgi:hypothetical protein
MDHDDLALRLRLIETMIAEGRRDTEYWGWAFVLWGVGHLAALGGSWFVGGIAWAIAMTACGAAMGIGVALAARRGRKSTAVGRALGAVWAGLGVSMFVAGMLGGVSGALPGLSIWLVFFILMGAASFASGLIVRWPLWSALGILWWAAAVVSMFATAEITTGVFVAMALIGEVGFGLHLMVRERREMAGAQASGS